MSTRPSPLPAGTDQASDVPAARPDRSPDPISLVSLIDIVLLLMAVPIVLLLGAPVLGVLVGAAIWIVQRGIELAVARVAATKDSVKAAVGYNLGAMVGRVWLIGLTILIVGTAGEREDGLAAAVLSFVAFTVYFAISLFARSFERNVSPS